MKNPENNSGEIVPRAEASLDETKEAKVSALVEKLESYMSVNWQRILQDMENIDPEGETKERLAGATVTYIQNAFKTGAFPNLEGIEPVLAFLNIDNIEFEPAQKDALMDFYNKYSLSFLYNMSPSLRDGKLWDGKPYERIAYTKELLAKAGATPEELSDEYVQRLWDLREVLVKMHYGKMEKTLFQPKQKLIDFVHKLKA